MYNKLLESKIESVKKKISETRPTICLYPLETEGKFFSFNNHNVTGKEINESLISPLQTKLISLNCDIKSLFGIVEEIYEVLNILDKEYISGILSAVESAKTASNQARLASEKANKASEEALSASNKAIEAQKDTRNTIKALEKTVEALVKFKSDVNNEIAKIECKVKQTDETIINQTKVNQQLLKLKHIDDIDNLWNIVEDNNAELSKLQKSSESVVERVSTIDESIKKIIDNKKVKSAYVIACFAIAFSIVQFILIVLGLL